MLGGLLLEQRYCGEVLMGGTVSSRWTSSFTVTGLITYLLPRGHTTLPSGRRTWSWCPICQTPIGIGRAGSFLLKGRTRYVVRRSGRRCLMAILIILGLTSKNQVKNVSYPFTCFILTFLTPFSSSWLQLLRVPTYLTSNWDLSNGFLKSPWIRESAGT